MIESLCWIVDRPSCLQRLDAKLRETGWNVHLSDSVRAEIMQDFSITIRVVDFIDPEDDFRYSKMLKSFLLSLSDETRIPIDDHYGIINLTLFEAAYGHKIAQAWKAHLGRVTQ